MNNIAASIPDFAKDLRLNHSSNLREDVLNDQQIGTLLVGALACQSYRLVQAIRANAMSLVDESVLGATYSAASIMAMNNVYYRFMHVLEHKIYKTLPVRLRMNVIANPT